MLGLALTNLKDIDAHYYTRKEKEGKKNEHHDFAVTYICTLQSNFRNVKQLAKNILAFIQPDPLLKV